MQNADGSGDIQQMTFLQRELKLCAASVKVDSFVFESDESSAALELTSFFFTGGLRPPGPPELVGLRPPRYMYFV